MDTKWLEDFLLLLDAGNFTKAAARRNVSQPAFSRRIQALEEWLGVRLVDRHRKPLRFTPLALEHQAEIRNLLTGIYRMRSQMLAEDKGVNAIHLAAQHTLAATYLPKLIRQLESGGLHYAYQLHSANKEDCVTLLMQGLAQFLVCYESTNKPERLSTTMDRLVVERDRLRLVSAVSNDSAVHNLSTHKPLPLLSYPQDSFLGKVLWDGPLPRLMRAARIEIVCESAFALGLRELARNGMGVAWLPESLIQRDLDCGYLASLDHVAAPCELDVVMYAHRHGANPDAQRIWEFLSDDRAEAFTPSCI